MNLSMKGEAIVTRSLKDLTDLDVELNATSTMEGTTAKEITVKLTGPMKITSKTALKHR